MDENDLPDEEIRAMWDEAVELAEEGIAIAHEVLPPWDEGD